MIDQELIDKASKIRAATGESMSKILKALRDNPPKPSQQLSTTTAANPAGPKQYRQTDFWKAVDKRMFERKETYTTAYKWVRRESPQLFDQMLQEVNS